MPLNHLEDRRHVRLASQARGGDRQARDRLVRELMPAAERIGRRFASPQHPVEDLAQVAMIGLLKAIDRFDSAHQAAFATYAHSLMTGEVRRHLRDTRFVRVPRPIYEQVPRFQRALDRLSMKHGRTPTRQELADELGLSKEELVEVADAALTAQPVSLEASIDEGAADPDVAHHDAEFDRAEDHLAIAPMLRYLTPRERMVLELRFNDGLSQAEIGAGLEISQTQVSRILRRALEKLSERSVTAAP